MKLKTLIVDDEPLAREGLLMYARECGIIEVVATCESALEAQEVLNQQAIDLMFLDIQMPRLTGLDFLKTLPSAPLVIIASAYPNFALQGFELDVVDYLVKPYPFDRFLKAVNKANDRFKVKKAQQPIKEVEESHIFIKTDNRYEKVNFDEILFIEGMENYIIIHLAERKIITLMSMKNVEELLPSNDFYRVHKSYIVATKAVNAIAGNELITSKGAVPFSRDKRAEVMERFLGKKE